GATEAARTDASRRTKDGTDHGCAARDVAGRRLPAVQDAEWTPVASELARLSPRPEHLPGHVRRARTPTSGGMAPRAFGQFAGLGRRRSDSPGRRARLVVQQLKVRIALAAALVAAATPVSAHHSAAMFDTTKQVAIDGVVTKFDWRNPHVYMAI